MGWRKFSLVALLVACLITAVFAGIQLPSGTGVQGTWPIDWWEEWWTVDGKPRPDVRTLHGTYTWQASTGRYVLSDGSYLEFFSNGTGIEWECVYVSPPPGLWIPHPLTWQQIY